MIFVYGLGPGDRLCAGVFYTDEGVSDFRHRYACAGRQFFTRRT